eukprot:Colp12_sorted_trinity150504_noHs@2064
MSSKQDVLNIINSNEVVVFSKSYCPYCVTAKKVFDGLKVKYFKMELDDVANGDAIQSTLQQLTGQRTVPNIFIKGHHVGGCDNTVAAQKNGNLDKLLKGPTVQFTGK